MVTRALLFAAIAATGACNWTVYDELADEAWVDRVTKPDSTDSREYGEALVAVPSRTAGASAFVIGKSRASLSTLAYDDEGRRQAINAIDPRTALSFGNFLDRPALAGDPDSDRVALTVVMGNNVDPTRVAVFDGRTLEQVKSVILNHPVEVDGVMDRVNIHAEGVAFGLVPGAGMDTVKELAVARGPQLILIQDYSEAESMTSTFAVRGCSTGADWSYSALLANVIDETTHAGPEILIATGEERRDGTSEILILDPAAIMMPYNSDPPTPCPAGVVPNITSTEGAMDLGARLAIGHFPDVLDPDPLAALDDLIYSAPGLNKVFVQFGGGTTVEISPSDTGSEFGGAITTGDILDDDGIPELIIGAPRSDPEGVANGGSVYVYRFVASPPSFVEALRLYPAEPKDEELFGKSVTVAPFGATGTKAVLMVGAEGEVFTYFRTAESDDVRAGRTP